MAAPSPEFQQRIAELLAPAAVSVLTGLVGWWAARRRNAADASRTEAEAAVLRGDLLTRQAEALAALWQEQNKALAAEIAHLRERVAAQETEIASLRDELNQALSYPPKTNAFVPMQATRETPVSTN